MPRNTDRKIYLAIIGDIKKSKSISDRFEVQKLLTVILNEINSEYAPSLGSKFMITLGDEFQGLLTEGGNALKIINQIEDKIYPVEVRFGIGIGSISTEINYDFPIGADGPAYYQARRMITAVRGLEKKTMSIDTNVLLCSEDAELEWSEEQLIDNKYLMRKNEVDRIDGLMNSTLSLCYVLKRKWSDRQREIIKAYESESYSQILAAAKLGVIQSSVNKSLSSSSYYSFRAAQQKVADYLSILCSKSNSTLSNSKGK